MPSMARRTKFSFKERKTVSATAAPAPPPMSLSETRRPTPRNAQYKRPRAHNAPAQRARARATLTLQVHARDCHVHLQRLRDRRRARVTDAVVWHMAATRPSQAHGQLTSTHTAPATVRTTHVHACDRPIPLQRLRNRPLSLSDPDYYFDALSHGAQQVSVVMARMRRLKNFTAAPCACARSSSTK